MKQPLELKVADFEKQFKKVAGKSDTNPNCFDELHDSVKTERPADSITCAEWAKRYNLSMSQAYKEIAKLLRDGKLIKHSHGTARVYTKAQK